MSIVRDEFHMCAKKLREILIRNGVNISLRSQPLNIEYFKNIDSPEKAYWLGFIAADGHINFSERGLARKLSFNVKDSDILLKFKNAIGAGSPVGHRFVFDKRTKKHYEQYNLQICSKEFCENIRKHGVDENKSKAFKFPNIEEKYYSHFIRGMYDGDGSLTLVRKRFQLSLISSIECLNFIKKYIFERYGWSLNNPSEKYHNENFNVYQSQMQKDAYNFLNWIYKDSSESCRLDRKYNKFKKNEKTFLGLQRTVKNVITGEEFKVWNISEFCDRIGLNQNILHRTLKIGACKKGIHAGWLLLPPSE